MQKVVSQNCVIKLVMKKTFILLVFVLSRTLFSQVNDSIQYISFPNKKEKKPINISTKNDTIYLFFNHKKYQDFGISSKKNDVPFQYMYVFYLNNKTLLDSYNNITISVLADGKLNYDKQADIKLINKKFIRKNKKIVYAIKEMRKKGAKKFLNEIGYATVYLIDTKIKENGNYQAREVKLYYPSEL
jgi:hypothetical protein